MALIPAVQEIRIRIGFNLVKCSFEYLAVILGELSNLGKPKSIVGVDVSQVYLIINNVKLILLLNGRNDFKESNISFCEILLIADLMFLIVFKHV